MKRVLAGLAIAGVLCAGLLLAALALERRADLTLPAPTGSFAVGREVEDWTDEAGIDPVAPAAGTRRELLVWIWYPAAADSGSVIDDYLPEYMRNAQAAAGSRILTLVTRDAARVHGHSLRNAPVAPDQATYPVVIMRGGASAGVQSYSTLAEDLASHGYIVVGIDAPYRTGLVVFPDGRAIRRAPENNPELYAGQLHAVRLNQVLEAWTSDMRFALDHLERLNASSTWPRFAGRLDLRRIGVFGHSFGGAQTAQFCHEDSRCRAGIDIDGLLLGSVVEAGLQQPFMFLFSDQDLSAPENRQIAVDFQSVYDRLPSETRERLQIAGANHFLFSDDGALLKSHIVMGGLRRVGLVGIDGSRQLEVTAYCVRTFFDGYLKQPTGGRITFISAAYPELKALQ